MRKTESRALFKKTWRQYLLWAKVNAKMWRNPRCLKLIKSHVNHGFLAYFPHGERIWLNEKNEIRPSNAAYI